MFFADETVDMLSFFVVFLSWFLGIVGYVAYQGTEGETRGADGDHWECGGIGEGFEGLETAFAEAGIEGGGEEGLGVWEGGGHDMQDLV